MIDNIHQKMLEAVEGALHSLGIPLERAAYLAFIAAIAVEEQLLVVPVNFTPVQLPNIPESLRNAIAPEIADLFDQYSRVVAQISDAFEERGRAPRDTTRYRDANLKIYSFIAEAKEIEYQLTNTYKVVLTAS